MPNRTRVRLERESMKDGQEPATSQPNKHHLNYLDGIRGICALYVVFHHVSTQLNYYQAMHQGPARLMLLMQKLFSWGGHDCVTIFICLSGFSLTIPLAKGGYDVLNNFGNLRNYFIRRALRIAPPYFCAIIGILLLAAVYPRLSIQTPTNWSFALPILDLQTVLYHLTFVHALDPNHVYRLSPQFWSIGTEAQLYVWLPLVLVPFALRKSILWGVVASLVACLILIPIKQFDRACLHYVFTFSLGALAADQIFNPLRKGVRVSMGVAALALGLFIVNVVLAKSTGSIWGTRDLVLSPVIALGIYLLVKDATPSNVVKRIQALLSTRVMAFLGKISYSLYLVHYVVIGFLHAVLVEKGVSIHLTVVSLILVAPILSIAVAKLLQMAAEAPSMKIAKGYRDRAKKNVLAESPMSPLK
jgi:peptidoglycan/LPS O-acetylase OafA/YrhL